MFHLTDDLHIQELRPLISPAILMEEIPMSEGASKTVAEARLVAEAIIRGTDPRLLVVVGPCSIHDTGAAVEYGRRLREAAERYKNELLVVMRVYFEKPRTTIGWKGLINDPDLDGKFRINRGLRMARQLLLDLAEMGLPSASEFLDTIIPQFIANLIAWGAIGARTTESQIHRQLASGLSMPIGFKNGTDGNIDIAVDAVRAAAHPHYFPGVTTQGISAIVATKGNDCCHIILRGSTSGPNYGREEVAASVAALEKANVTPRLMIDCSHGNSRKDHTRQPAVVREVAEEVKGGSPAILGVMIESHLVGGRQEFRPGARLTYGQSITDACIAWEDTDPLLEALATAVSKR